MKNIILLIYFVSISTLSNAQGEANNWCFGNGCWLDFNSGNPVDLPGAVIFTNEGCASVSDASGTLMFYTDGIYCWDKNHNQMPGVIDLGGNSSSTQSAIIVPQPGSSSLYYIFTVDAQAGIYGGTGGLNYSIIDMTLNGGLGDVTVQNISLITPTAEKVTVANAANGTDWWIVTHEWNNNNFASFSLTSSGLNLTPVISSIGSVHSDIGSGNNAESIGYMKISSDGQYLGLVCYTLINLFELFDFNSSTGQVTNLIVSDNAFPNSSGLTGPYGFSFSPDNSKAYVSVFGFSPDPSELFQYDISSGNSAAILASKTLVGSSSDYFGALQTAIDQKIYLAISGSNYLDRIDNPNAMGMACNFTTNVITLSGSSSFGLPDFFEGFFTTGLQAVLNYDGCTGNDNLLFIDTVLNDPYIVHWDFGDLNSTTDTSNSENPTFNFPGPGNYTVTLTVTLTTGGSFSVTQIISIGGALPLITSDDTLICSNTLTQLTVDINNATYLWSPSTGLSCFTCQNPVASPISNTNYIVTVSTLYCTGVDSVLVEIIPGTIAYAYNDTSICIGASTIIGATGGTDYKWWPDIELSNTTEQVITASPATTTTYFVEVKGANNCPADTASVVVTILPLPVVEAGMDIVLTEGEPGQLNGTTNGVTNFWHPDIYLSHKYILDPTFIATTSTTYHLWSIDANGCMNTDSTHVIVEPAFLLFVNAFTPNDDGRNDLFEYFRKGVSEVQLEVYNRWGERLFFTKNIDEFWNGKQDDVSCPIGVYIYIATAKTWSGRTITANGNVTIIK